MMQQINLLFDLQKPNPYLLTARRAFTIFLCMFGLLFAIIFFQLVYMGVQKITLHRTEIAQIKLTRKLESELYTQQDKKNEPFKNYAAQVRYQEILLKKIEQHYSKAPFQPVLNLVALATATPKGLWLTRMVFKDQGSKIIIQGSAINSELILKFQKQINAKLAFKNIVFKTAALTNDTDNEQVNFTLNTEETNQ